MVEKEERLIKWFSDIRNEDISLVGVKGMHLGELYRRKFPVPSGFVISVKAYNQFLDESLLRKKILGKIHNLKEEVNENNESELVEKVSLEIISDIEKSTCPLFFEEAIRESYELLNMDHDQMRQATASALLIMKNSFELPFVAVRNSAVFENDSGFSSLLNVKGVESVISEVKAIYASLYTSEAIRNFLRTDLQKLPETAVIIQEMIHADSSGYISQSVDSNEWIISAVWGFGEAISSGEIIPDLYRVGKENDILEIKCINVADKKKAQVRNSAGNCYLVSLTEDKSNQQVLNNHEIINIARYAEQIRQVFDVPQEIDFVLSGKDIYIVSSRPLKKVVEEKVLEEVEELFPESEIETIIEVSPFSSHAIIISPQNEFLSHRIHLDRIQEDTEKQLKDLARDIRDIQVKLTSKDLNSSKLDEEVTALYYLSKKCPDKYITTLIPKVSHPEDLNSIKDLFRSKGYLDKMKFGVSIENPASLQLINQFCQDKVNSISIEELSLVSTLLGLNSQEINDDSLNHPALISAIRHIVKQAHKYKVPVYLSLKDLNSIKRMNYLNRFNLDGFSIPSEDFTHFHGLLNSSIILRNADNSFLNFLDKKIVLPTSEDIESILLRELDGE
ncbi:hypothetical protein COU54_00070 [Candidatus Pacearchaeota archaeon CG10_big_fil_rev_8_21_14_0_10_31_24]|nr:MAG: hypothetical protein COU54_00070 [Candidatus Pacearchaeota archaeon CG10_big_fil_rev_8_21_14_0_10_31_24]